MAIPDYQTLMLPLLQYVDDQQEHSLRESIKYLATKFELTEADIQELLPSGKQARFANRVGWSGTHLKKAGLLQYPRRGYFQITERGLKILKEQPNKITSKFLRQFPEYLEFIAPATSKPDKIIVHVGTNDITKNVTNTIEKCHKYNRKS